MMGIKNILMVTVLIFLACFSIYIFMFIGINTKYERMSNLDGEIKSFIGMEEDFREMKSLLEKTSGDREELLTFFVPSDGVFTFVEFIESLAKSQNLTVTTESVTVVGGEKGVLLPNKYAEELQLEVHTQGDRSSSIHFLELIESLPYGVEVISANTKRIYPHEDRGEIWEGRYIFKVIKLL